MSDVSNEFFNAIYYHSQPQSWAFSLQIIAGLITYVITYIAKPSGYFNYTARSYPGCRHSKEAVVMRSLFWY